MLLSGFPQNKGQSRAEKRFSGFTIVELLVAMMIGSVLAISVVALFINQTRAMALNEDLVDLEQNLRIAMDFLHRDSRMAGANTKDVLPPFTIGIIDDVDVDRDGDVDADDVINSEGGPSSDALQIIYAEAQALVVQKYKGNSNHFWLCGPSGIALGQSLMISRTPVDDKHLSGEDKVLMIQTFASRVDDDSSCPGDVKTSCSNTCEKIFTPTDEKLDDVSKETKYDGGHLWPSMKKITYFVTDDANNDGTADDPALMRALNFAEPAIVAYGITDLQLVYIRDNGVEITEISETDPAEVKAINLSLHRARIQISGETRNAHNRIGGTTGKRQRTMTTEVQVRNLVL